MREAAKRISECHFWWLKPRSTQLRDRTRNILESQGCQTQNCNEFEQFHCPTHTKKIWFKTHEELRWNCIFYSQHWVQCSREYFVPNISYLRTNQTPISCCLSFCRRRLVHHKKTWKILEKTLRSFQQGTVFHIFLHWCPPFMTKNWSILFKKHKVGGWILPKLVCGSSWHECLNLMTMFTLLGRILSMMFDCSSSPKKQWWWNHNSPI